jgi:ribosomal protein S18 acetylase RimI-like enzyme
MNIISGNKDIISGCEEDIQSIAKIYLEAFPESVDFFFRGDAGDRILRIIALGFSVLLDAGCKFFVAKDSLGNLCGYSIVALDDAELHKAVIRHGHALGAARALFAGKIAIRFTEMLKLGANGMVMAASSRVLPRRTSFGRLMSIAVHKGARGQGLGRGLLRRALQCLADEGVQVVRLEVRSENTPAYELYRTEGFSEIGVTRDLQGRWVAMEKLLFKGRG